MENKLKISADRQRELFVKGMALARTFTRGVRLVSVSMLQRHLSIDFQEAQWLLDQMQHSEGKEPTHL